MSFKPKTYSEALLKKQTKDRTHSVRAKTPLKKKVTKKKVVSITKLKKQLWDECRRIVRARDISKDGYYRCFTCGNITDIPHTGHVLASSLCSTEMRYSLDNLFLQDYLCNIHRSGNWVSFYEKLGKEYIEDLIKRNNETKCLSYHRDWYLNKIEEYKKINFIQ